MAAVQGRALIFTVLCIYIYTYRWYLPEPCPASLLLQSVHRQNYTDYHLSQVSFIAPKSGMGETNENHISLCLPKQGHPTAAVQGAGGIGSHPPQLKRNPNSLNKQTKEYAKSKQKTHPPPPPHTQKCLLLLNFPFWTLARKQISCFGKTEHISAHVGEVLHFPHFQSANCERAPLIHV